MPWRKVQESEFHFFALAKGPCGLAALTKLPAHLPQGEHFITSLAQTRVTEQHVCPTGNSATRSRAEVSESLNIRFIITCTLGTSLQLPFPLHKAGGEAGHQQVRSSSFQPPSLLQAVPFLPWEHEAPQNCSPGARGLSQSQADGCLMKDAANSPVHAVFEGEL